MGIIEEVKKIIDAYMGKSSATNKASKQYDCARTINQLYEAQAKKLLLGISKETKKLDGTIYLVPDYSKFREALKELGIEEAQNGQTSI